MIGRTMNRKNQLLLAAAALALPAVSAHGAVYYWASDAVNTNWSTTDRNWSASLGGAASTAWTTTGSDYAQFSGNTLSLSLPVDGVADYDIKANRIETVAGSNVTLDGSGSSTIGSVNVSRATMLTTAYSTVWGAGTSNSNTNASLLLGGNSTLTIGSGLFVYNNTGSGANFTINGSGTLNLSGTLAKNNYAAFIISGGATLRVKTGGRVGGESYSNTTGAFSTGATNNSMIVGNGLSGNGTVIVEGGTVDLSTSASYPKSLTISGTASGGNSGITDNQNKANVDGTVYLTSGNIIVSPNGSSSISFGPASATAGVSAQLAGTRNGTFHLDGGTLSAGNKIIKQAQSATSTGTYNATFNFNGGTLKVTTDSANTPAAFFTGFGTGGTDVVNVRDGGAIIDTNGVATTIAYALTHSNISGDKAVDGGLTKLGNGTLTLAGLNTYNGNTTVSGGTLSLAYASLDDLASVSLANSTALNLAFTGTDTVGGLILDGVAQTGGTYGAIGSGAQHETSYITGTGTLLVSVPEPATLSLLAGGISLMLLSRQRRRSAR